MDIRQLEVLGAVADSGSFTAASRQLHVSQSAVSRQILLLEEEIGEPVFLRLGRRVRLLFLACGFGVGWLRPEFDTLGVAYAERGAITDEYLRAMKALWTESSPRFHGKYVRFENVIFEPKPIQKPHPPIWIGGGTQPSEKIYAQSVPNIDPVLRRIAKYARTWVPHSSATPDMVRSDWDRIQRFMAEGGRKPGDMGRVYSNFVYVLDKGERPEAAVPHFSVYSGMDLPYWREYYLLGEAEEVAEKIRARIAVLGGVEHVVLNPLHWGADQLERLAGDVLPRVARP